MSQTLAALSRCNIHMPSDSRNLPANAHTDSRRDSARQEATPRCGDIARLERDSLPPAESLAVPRFPATLGVRRPAQEQLAVPCDASPSLPHYPRRLRQALANEDSAPNLNAAAIRQKTNQVQSEGLAVRRIRHSTTCARIAIRTSQGLLPVSVASRGNCTPRFWLPPPLRIELSRP